MLLFALVAAIFRIGVEKKLAGSLTEHEWGRYLFAIGATLTDLKWGIGGYVVDDVIEQKLQVEGLTDNPRTLAALNVKFPKNLRDQQLLQSAIERTRAFEVSPPLPGDYQRLRGSHGDDVGLVNFVSLSFRLFGFKISSIYQTYFLVLGGTILLFLLGHWGSPAAVACVALMTLALYLLVCSDLVNLTRMVPPHVGNGGSDIKDPRFFGTLAAFPALHLLLLWISNNHRLEIFDYVVMIGQAVIFAVVIQIRWPVLWLLASLLGYWIVCLVLGRSTRFRPLRQQSVLAGIITLTVGAGIAATSISAHLLYELDGDLLHHPLWHNVLTTLEVNPEWEVQYLPMVNGKRSDEMPTEVARQEIAKLPLDQQSQYFARGHQPSPAAIMFFARERFLQILRSNPWFVLETFLVYQTPAILADTRRFFQEFFQVLSPAKALVIAAALGAIVWLACTDSAALAVLGTVTVVGAAYSAIALLPMLIVAPPYPLLMIDHFLWFFFFLCSLVCWGATWTIRRLKASRSG